MSIVVCKKSFTALKLSLLAFGFVSTAAYFAAAAEPAVETRVAETGPIDYSAKAAEAFGRLTAGNRRFVADQPQVQLNATSRATLATGQHPIATVITCSDSRVVPELLFDQGFGDLFVVRVAGNIVEPAVVGTVEYGVKYLKTPLVVVLAHENCGAVDAALHKKSLTGDLDWLVKQIALPEVAANELPVTLPTAVAFNAQVQAARLVEQTAGLKQLLADEQARLVIGVYSLNTGKVQWLPSEPAAE